MNDTNELRELPTEQLVPPQMLLRPVKQNSIEYLELKDSIAERGILNSISVRPCLLIPGKYEIIDGMYRWTCAKEIGLQTIPAVIMHNVTDMDVLALQIQANAIRPTTSPCDFARQLKRIQKDNPQITIAQIAVMVCKSPSWVQRQLGLLLLQPDHQKMIDRGEICLKNAYMLAKIPCYLRADYLDRAKTMPAAEFSTLAANVVKQVRESVRQGKMDAFFTARFEPQPYLRSLKEVQDESKTHVAAALIITAENFKTAIDGWNAALKWIMHLDRRSVEEQEHAFRAKARKSWKSRCIS